MHIDLGKTLISKVLFPFLVGASVMIGKHVGDVIFKNVKKGIEKEKVKAQ